MFAQIIANWLMRGGWLNVVNKMNDAMYITEMRYALWKGKQINQKSIDMHAILLLSIPFIYHI